MKFGTGFHARKLRNETENPSFILYNSRICMKNMQDDQYSTKRKVLCVTEGNLALTFMTANYRLGIKISKLL